MKPEFILSFAAAAVCHALLLFGFRLGTLARPLPVTDETVEVSLVAAPPEPPAVEAPPPQPTPEPVPEPTPVPKEEPMATPAPEPPLEKPTPPPAPPVPLRKPKTTAARPHPSTSRATGATHPATGPAISARPRYRSNPKPEYPAEARRARQQGLVMVSVEVDSNGRALNVSLMRSCGFPMLDDAALQAVRHWTFEPARIGGLPVSSHVDVPVRFSIAQ